MIDPREASTARVAVSELLRCMRGDVLTECEIFLLEDADMVA